MFTEGTEWSFLIVDVCNTYIEMWILFKGYVFVK